MQSGNNNLPALVKLQNEGYEVVVFDDNSDNDLYKIIAYKYNNIVGTGSYGNVYKGYIVNPQTFEVDRKRKLAIKVFKGSSQVDTKEAKFFNAYYDGCQLLTSGGDKYMVMSFLPGNNIMVNSKNNKDTILDIEITKFNFMRRAELLANIMMAMNVIHHNTPQTGPALVHGDIKGENIKIHIDPDTGAINVYIVDFGLADAIEDNPDVVRPTVATGTPLFMSAEIMDKEVRGVKSDIYSLTPIFIAILGGTNPFAFKMEIPWWKPEYFETPYDFTGMYEGFDVPQLSFDLAIFINRFLSRMQNKNFEQRPDSDDCLKFFVTLNNLLKIHDKDPNDPAIQACGATLAVLADGITKDCLQVKSARSTPVNLDGIQEDKQYFDVNDADNLEIVKQIIEQSQLAPLNSQSIQNLLSPNTESAFTRWIGLFTSYQDLSDTIRELDQQIPEPK